MTGLARSAARRLRSGVKRLPPVRRLLEDRDRLRAQLEESRRHLQRYEKQTSTARAKQEEALARITARLEESQQRNHRLLADTADLVRPTARQELGYLFIVTYGRSGSTVLQAVLNTIPGYVVRGENRDALKHLFAYHSLLSAEADAHRDTAYSRRSPWWGIDGYAKAAAVTGMRDLVVQTLLRPEADTRVVGFKEIRWWHRDWQGYQDFLLEVFPGARFVINTRDHAAVAKSRWWQDDPDPAAKLAGYEAQLSAMAERLGPERAFRVHYDDWVGEPERLRPLFSWLGETYDHEAVTAALSHRYSY